MNWILKPEAIPEQVKIAHSIGRGMLIPRQIDELVKAINPSYVETKQRLTYLAQHQARAEMNRIFGYGNWDVDADDPVLIYETQQPGSKDPSKMYWVVAYRTRVTVHVRDLWGMPVASYTGVHAEENAPQPYRGEAHALALTSVDSYALRRALINLGDRFGLGLYDKGSTAPHGQYTIQQPGNPRDGAGALYSWVDDVQSTPNAAQVPPQAEAPKQTKSQARMEKFNEVQQNLQASREEARNTPMSPEMQARLQGGLKTGDGGAPDAFGGSTEVGDLNG